MRRRGWRRNWLNNAELKSVATKARNPESNVLRPAQHWMYRITLSDSNWWLIVAKSRVDALRVLYSAHFQNLALEEFINVYNPSIENVPDGEVLTLDDKGVDYSKTAEQWCSLCWSHPFTSNTY